MAIYYFGAFRSVGSGPAFNDGPSPAANTGDWSTLSNWWINPGGVGYCSCGCYCGGQNGVQATAFPTIADTVILLSPLTTVPTSTLGFSGGMWSGPVRLGGSVQTLNCFSGVVTVNPVPDPRGGASPFWPVASWNIAGTCAASSVVLEAFGTIQGGTFNVPIVKGATNPGTISGGTFNNTTTASVVTGGTFNSTFKLPGMFNFSGGTFNGAWDTSLIGAGSLNGTISGGTFATLFPPAPGAAVTVYNISGGTFNWAGDLVIGKAGAQMLSTLTDIVTSKNIIFLGSPKNVSFTGNSSNYTGILSGYGNNATVSGTGTYSPPYTTAAIKSGNNMTFNSAAMPSDPGFAKAGGTFSPVVMLTGTSNDILGAGLQ
jgi:hypothetical protein